MQEQRGLAEPTRRSNAERRRSTRSAVLDATIEAIVRYGYVGATSARIAALSGFTRGAQLHHFKNKADMVAEALVHLHRHRMDAQLGELELASRQGVSAFLQALWSTYQDDLFTADAELRVAARSDVELRAVLTEAEQRIGRRVRQFMTGALDDGRQSRERLVEISDLVLNTMRGMAFQRTLSTDAEREQRQLRVLDESVRALLEANGPGSR